MALGCARVNHPSIHRTALEGAGMCLRARGQKSSWLKAELCSFSGTRSSSAEPRCVERGPDLPSFYLLSLIITRGLVARAPGSGVHRVLSARVVCCVLVFPGASESGGRSVPGVGAVSEAWRKEVDS